MKKDFESRQKLVNENLTRHDDSRENSLPPVELTFVRGRVGVGSNSQHKPRPCGCNTRKLVNNRFPALKGWGLRGNNSQNLININHSTHFTHLTHSIHLRKRSAFTLAEVLITLAVIGIVAAMTIPNLVQSYKKKVVETRLLQFYSMMNQAVKLSEIDYGDQTSWVSDDLNTYSIEEFFNTYFAPHLKYSKLEIQDNATIMVYFANGSAMTMSNHAINTNPHIYFYPFGQKKDDSSTGIDRFLFIQPIHRVKNFLYSKGVQPYSQRNGGWDGLSNDEIDKILRDDENYGCYTTYKRSCAAVIMRNGWKIPEDYPFKF